MAAFQVSTEGHLVTSRPLNQTYERISPENHKPHQAAVHNAYQSAELSPKAKKIILIVGAVAILALAIISAIYLLSDDTDEPIKTSQPAQPAMQPTATVVLPAPLLIVTQNGKDQRILNEAAFFEYARGVTIADEAAFKEVLTTFLFRFSPEVHAVYKGNKDALWQQIRASNPNSRQRLSVYLNEKAPFRIEDNADQQAILRGLVILR